MTPFAARYAQTRPAGPRPKPGPAKARPPRTEAWEREYARRVLALQTAFQDHVETIGRAALGRRDAARADAGDLEKELRAAYQAIVKASGLEHWLSRFAGQISDANAAYVKRIVKIPPGTIARQRLIEDFRQENVALITKASEKQISQVATVLRTGQASGARWEEMVPEIQGRLNVGKSRAKLIARDQTNKFNGAMQQIHQESSGITEYTWATMKDSAVRGRPGGVYADSKEDHWALEGKRFKWTEPPQIPGTSEHAHPGQRINCRCQAIPVVPFFE